MRYSTVVALAFAGLVSAKQFPFLASPHSEKPGEKPAPPPEWKHTIDLSNHTILEILNFTLTHDDSKAPLKIVAHFVNDSHAAQEWLSQDDITIFAPDDFFLEHLKHESEFPFGAHPPGPPGPPPPGPPPKDGPPPPGPPHVATYTDLVKDRFLSVLKYHTLPKTIYSKFELLEEPFIDTALTEDDVPLTIKPSKHFEFSPFPHLDVRLNGFTRIRGPVILAKNGAIFTIQGILRPPLTAAAELTSHPTHFSTAALAYAKLSEEFTPLLKGRNVTVFTPSNKAFEQLNPFFEHRLFGPETKALKDLVAFHIVPDIEFFSDVESEALDKFVIGKKIDVKLPARPPPGPPGRPGPPGPPPRGPPPKDGPPPHKHKHHKGPREHRGHGEPHEHSELGELGGRMAKRVHSCGRKDAAHAERAADSDSMERPRPMSFFSMLMSLAGFGKSKPHGPHRPKHPPFKLANVTLYKFDTLLTELGVDKAHLFVEKITTREGSELIVHPFPPKHFEPPNKGDAYEDFQDESPVEALPKRPHFPPPPPPIFAHPQDIVIKEGVVHVVDSLLLPRTLLPPPPPPPAPRHPKKEEASQIHSIRLEKDM